MPRLLERLHTLWTALRLRLRGGAPGVFYIGGSDTMPAPLEREAEQQAIRALTAGSEDAASLLIEHNLRLVVYIARRFENTGIHIEDLISIGTIGLVKAIHLQAGQEHQACDLRLALHRKRDPHVSAQMQRPENGGEH